MNPKENDAECAGVSRTVHENFFRELKKRNISSKKYAEDNFIDSRAQNASSGSPSSGTVLSRAATVYDITVDREPNLSGLGAKCIVRPAVNIVGLRLYG